MLVFAEGCVCTVVILLLLGLGHDMRPRHVGKLGKIMEKTIIILFLAALGLGWYQAISGFVRDIAAENSPQFHPQTYMSRTMGLDDFVEKNQDKIFERR